MAPRRRNMEISLIRIEFSNTMKPKATQSDTIQSKYPPRDTTEPILDWIEMCLNRENGLMPAHSRVRYLETRIKCGNADLFTIDECRYDRIQIILGEDSAYWVFYNKLPSLRRMEGRGILNCSYCGCCAGRHYERIVETCKKSEMVATLSVL